MARHSRENVLCARSATLRAVRRFFLDRDFVEVETPVRIPAPALELHIDAEPSGDLYLRTSPELHMKRLMAEGMRRIFQVGPCFRRGEQGALHHPEYTMLEWYRADSDYMGVLADTESLLRAVVRDVRGDMSLQFGDRVTDLAPDWTRIAVRDAFREFAGWDPVASYDADRFDLDLVTKVQPALPAGRPVVLMDYPVPAAALARCTTGHPPVAERWELYVGGVELANAFSELTDAREQRRRFEECAVARRMAGRDTYGMDERFLAALERGLPECGGVALGVDRLVMLLTGATTVADVLPFSGDA